VPSAAARMREERVDRLKFLLVDDNDGFRARVKEFLTTRFDTALVEEASNGRQAVSKARAFRPAIVLMDIKMTGESGLDTTRRLKAALPDTQVIVVSRFDLHEYRQAAQACGACGYVVKRKLVEELCPAISDALSGEGCTRANARDVTRATGKG